MINKRNTLFIVILVFFCSIYDVKAFSRTADPLNFTAIKIPSSKNPSHYGHESTTLLFSCIDFRLRDEVGRLMEAIGLRDQYDEVVLPGGSIAIAGEKYPYWGAAALELIKISKDLHNIKQVIILDHKDCGAFKLAYGTKALAGRVSEQQAHEEQMRKAITKIKSHFPDLRVYVYIMDVDGTVENWSNRF